MIRLQYTFRCDQPGCDAEEQSPRYQVFNGGELMKPSLPEGWVFNDLVGHVCPNHVLKVSIRRRRPGRVPLNGDAGTRVRLGRGGAHG